MLVNYYLTLFHINKKSIEMKAFVHFLLLVQDFFLLSFIPVIYNVIVGLHNKHYRPFHISSIACVFLITTLVFHKSRFYMSPTALIPTLSSSNNSSSNIQFPSYQYSYFCENYKLKYRARVQEHGLSLSLVSIAMIRPSPKTTLFGLYVLITVQY